MPGDPVEIGRPAGIAHGKRHAGGGGVVAAGRLGADHPAVLAGDQPAADMQRCRPQHLAVVAQRQLGGAAADIEIEDARLSLMAGLGGTGAVGRQHRLHVVAGGGGDEIAALSATMPAIASAFSRLSASPVRMTTPVSMSSGRMRAS